MNKNLVRKREEIKCNNTTKNTKVDVKEDNLNWTETHGHVYRILIAGRSESVKKKKKKKKEMQYLI